MRKFIIIFLIIFSFNLLFYITVYGDLNITSYIASQYAWQDQIIFYEEANKYSSEIRMLSGANLYSTLMYSIFNKSMIWSIVLNSIIFSITISLLLKIKKSYSTLYFIGLFPFIAYFSIGFTKEALIILGLVLFYRYIVVRNFTYLFLSIVILIIARPLYAIPLTVLSILFVRNNIKIYLSILLLLTPIFFWSIKMVFVNSYYVERFDNFENTLRMYYPLLSLFGNLIALGKSYADALLTPIYEQGLQYYILFTFLLVNTVFIISNISKIFKSESLIFLFILFVITMGPISHFRYLIPILFVLGYLVLPNRFRTLDTKHIIKGSK